MTLSTSENIKDGRVGPPNKTLKSASIPRNMKKYIKNKITVTSIIRDQILICSLDIFSNQSYRAAMIPTLNIMRYCGKKANGNPSENLSMGETKRMIKVKHPKIIAIRSK